jgi:hypothetical protein
MKPRLQRISYGEGFLSESMQILKKAREVALADNFKARDSYKEAHDKKATHHNLKQGDYAYLDNQLLLGKNKKLLQRWIEPYLVKKVINEQKVSYKFPQKESKTIQHTGSKNSLIQNYKNF